MNYLKQILFVLLFQFGFGLHVSPQVTINIPNPNNAQKWDIYEITFIANDNIYANPFWDIEIKGIFTGPNSEILNIGGFYYDTNTWKLRFSPTEEGIWEFLIHFKTPNDTVVFEGNFECLPANDNHGFLEVSKNNPYNFIYSDGTSLLINGINGHTPSVTAALLGIPNTPPPADSLMTKLMWEYLASRNINTYRLQMFHQNWAAPVSDWNEFEGLANLLQNSGSLDKYDISNAKLIDKWFRNAAENGVNIYPCLFTIHDDGNVYFFNQSPWSVENGGFYTNLTDMYSTATGIGHDYAKKYVKYIINRYGAFHNILAWEYNNEWGKYTSQDWINSIDTVITNNDPYNRAHVVSYWGFDYSFDSELHNLSSNEIVDFHVYPWAGYNSEFTIDSLINDNISYFYNKYEKPILIGEFGSGDFDNNIPPEDHYFDRVGYWTTFISGGSALFWLRGDNTSTGIDYNIETLEWIKSFGDITSNIQYLENFIPQNNIITTSDNSNLRAYCLGANNEFVSYIHHFSNHDDNIINNTLQVSVPSSSWEISWYDPSSGLLISTETIVNSNGTLNIDIPDFNVDIVLFLYTSSNLGLKPLQDIGKCQISCNPNPFSSEVLINFHLMKREIVKLSVYALDGRKIKQWDITNQQLGWHEVVWDGTDINGNTVPTGVYIYSLQASDFIDTKKMVFMK
jgi:hypothetical protein